MKAPLTRFRFAVLTLLVGLSSIAALPLVAQTTTGSIYGTVADATGAAIPHAAVALTNVDTNILLKTESNAEGSFIFPVVDPGNYKVSAQATGFKVVVQNGIALSANQNVNASVSLPVSSAGTDNTVNVEAGVTLVDTRESQIGETIDQQRIVELPTQGRSAYDLVQIVPGITNYTAPAATGDTTGVNFTTNGLRSNFNSFYLDGALNNEVFRGGGAPLPNPDALGEFRLLTTNFDAEFGRYPGGVSNVITRSGINKYHGVVYDYLRNNVLNAKPYFQTSIPRLVQNNFGASVGGHIIRDKAFVYLSYQGLRVGQSSIVTTAGIFVPTALERVGNFTQSPKKPNATICPGSICPVNPVIANIIALLPASDPNSLGTANGAHLLAQESAAKPGENQPGCRASRLSVRGA